MDQLFQSPNSRFSRAPIPSLPLHPSPKLNPKLPKVTIQGNKWINAGLIPSHNLNNYNYYKGIIIIIIIIIIRPHPSPSLEFSLFLFPVSCFLIPFQTLPAHP